MVGTFDQNCLFVCVTLVVAAMTWTSVGPQARVSSIKLGFSLHAEKYRFLNTLSGCVID